MFRLPTITLATPLELSTKAFAELLCEVFGNPPVASVVRKKLQIPVAVPLSLDGRFAAVGLEQIALPAHEPYTLKAASGIRYWDLGNTAENRRIHCVLLLTRKYRIEAVRAAGGVTWKVLGRVPSQFVPRWMNELYLQPSCFVGLEAKDECAFIGRLRQKLAETELVVQ